MPRKTKMALWTRRDFIKTAGIFGGMAVVGCPADAHTSAWISDTAVHAPPTTGPYAYSPPYGTFLPGQSGFPAAGGTYTDPVFARSIRRLTATNPLTPNRVSDIYVKNGWWNATATHFANTFPDSTLRIIEVLTGVATVVGPNVECSFSPVNADVFYFFSGTQLKQKIVSSGVVSVVKDFGATLGQLGGSVDWIDGSGRYMLLNLGNPAFRIWDRQTDTLFTGAITDDFQNGWVGIMPDASYVVMAADLGIRRRYAINTGAQTLASTGTQFFAKGSAHADLICPSDGHRYLMYVNNDNNPAFLARVDIETGIETACFTYPTDAYWTSQAEYISAVSVGPLRDWVLCNSAIEGGPTAPDDNFTAPDPVAAWGRMQNEIYMVNVLTGELRRLAHTRTRQVMTNYNYFPRVCVSWDGTRVAWASNMGYRSSPDGYADIWALDLGATGPPAPSGLSVR